MVCLHIDLIEESLDNFNAGRRPLDHDGVGDVVGDEESAADKEGFWCGINLRIGKGVAAGKARARARSS